jgi:hypothetical protein
VAKTRPIYEMPLNEKSLNHDDTFTSDASSFKPEKSEKSEKIEKFEKSTINPWTKEINKEN